MLLHAQVVERDPSAGQEDPCGKGHRRRHIDIAEYPNFGRWLEAMKARPAVRRGIDLLSEHQDRLNTGLDGEAIEQLFGATQYQRH